MVARDANTKGTLFRLLGIDPFNPMRLIKQTMAFPVIMMMDIYIDNYIKKYGGHPDGGNPVDYIPGNDEFAEGMQYNAENAAGGKTITVGTLRGRPVTLKVNLDNTVNIGVIGTGYVNMYNGKYYIYYSLIPNPITPD